MAEKKKFKEFKPYKAWLVVREDGHAFSPTDLWLSKSEAKDCCYPDEGERVIRVLITEVPSGK
jgi:hypothetical protein